MRSSLVGRGVLTAPSKSRDARGRLRRARPTLFALVFAILVASGNAANISEDFSGEPLTRGWRVFGDSSLFRWNATNQNVDVTWDSSRTNSYFWLPLRTVLSRSDDFTIAFDLKLHDITIGTTSNKPNTFQIALGFLNMSNATRTNFWRGAGHSAVGPRNLVEFDYFPAWEIYGATFAPTIATSNNVISFSDNHPVEMTTGDLFHIEMRFTATNRILKTIVTKNGAAFNTMQNLTLGATADFRCDALAIMSYSDAIQTDPDYDGSVLAHGAVDNIVAIVPDPPVQNLVGTRSNTTWRVQFQSRTNWSYALERTTDFGAWSSLPPTNTGTGNTMLLQDTNAANSAAFYRVRAMKP